MRVFLLVAGLLALVAPVSAAAQQTRAELLEQQRAQRAAQLVPYTPTAIERTLLYVEDKRLLERLTYGFRGVYPRIGGVTVDSGLALGVGYRHGRPRIAALAVDASAGLSTRGYQAVGVRLRARPQFGGRLELDGGSRWWDYPQEDFFGLGESSRDRRSNYRYQALSVDLRARVRLVPWLSLGGELGYLRPTIADGTDSRVPSTGQRFTDAEAPGLTRQPRLLSARSFIDLDYRDRPGNPRTGGRVLVEFGRWRDQDPSRAFSFRRIDLSVLQIVPIFDTKRRFVLRVAAGHADPIAGDGRVPFFLAPTLGGAMTLRGYRELRFRDASYAVANAEYRWEVVPALDLALFWDGGDVGTRTEDLRWTQLKTGWGAGLRFHTLDSVFLRTDVGFGREGTRFFLRFGPSF